jgi:hypothetical protein
LAWELYHGGCKKGYGLRDALIQKLNPAFYCSDGVPRVIPRTYHETAWSFPLFRHNHKADFRHPIMFIVAHKHDHMPPRTMHRLSPAFP